MAERKRQTAPLPPEEVDSDIEPSESDESSDVEPAIAIVDSECIYPPHDNQCPRCGEKIRTDLYGELMCAIAEPECPRLER
ncbi:hypothetical protein IQ268_08545 [Oculatella sp. LEGE 06141]|uniref:hypothetical protein n=1 Tax=Oculatella sp. LEGE 06141 TaxID=1828648 RepID=UPI00187E4B93|nr:hypothetical protein [Oculatella sp. LEGE 06141]MBE9178606.1 hypothetical protein [Oculatella sp. LEGE 06141]